MTLAEVRAEALRSLIPPPKLRLSEWIEQTIVLPAGVSALPGKVRLFPYQIGIADAITDPGIEYLSLVKSARCGFTTLLTAAIGSYVANDPAPILCLLPTEQDCRDYVVNDIEPIFSATPCLRGSLAADRVDGEDRNTLLSKRFPGGSLKIVAARAPRNLRRHTARVLIVDEADACETGSEGNLIRLAERRTMVCHERTDERRCGAV
jgi:phage terminase large subunit GpA-like protein